MSKRLSIAQSMILDFALASLHLLKAAAVENGCTIDELSEQQIMECATKRKKKTTSEIPSKL